MFSLTKLIAYKLPPYRKLRFINRGVAATLQIMAYDVVIMNTHSLIYAERAFFFKHGVRIDICLRTHRDREAKKM